MRDRFALLLANALAYAVLCAPCVRCAFGEERQVEPPEQAPLPLTSKPIDDVTVLPGDKATKVAWGGQDYDVDTGINVLMEVIRENEPASGRRQMALSALHRLHGQIKGTSCVEQLVALYPRLLDPNEKAAVLICLATSRDARALPLFHHVLSEEDNEIVRLPAAGGLAQWNVRAGVEELVRLLASKSPLPNKRLLRDEASKVFTGLNSRKGWGFSEPDVREAISRNKNLSEDEVVDLWLRHINDWFDENRRRFPDWNAGDTLPDDSHSGTGRARK